MIATLTQLKSYLNITWTEQDTILTLLLNAANQMIETYLWRTIEADDYVEFVDWNGQKKILLLNYPVNTLTKIEYNIWELDNPVRQEINPTSYKLSPKDWRIFLTFLLRRWFQNYKIAYNWWYTDIPADLVLASLKLASKYYNTKTSDWISGESVNWDSLSFDVSQIPNDILIILNNYKSYDV